MKRVILEIKKDFVNLIGLGSLFRYVEQVEIQRIFRFDESTMIAIQKFRFFDEGFTPENLKEIKSTGITRIEILDQIDERTYLCLVKTEQETRFHEILSNFDVLLDYPLIVRTDYIKIPLIGDESLFEQIQQYLPPGQYRIIKSSEITPKTERLDSSDALLTDRQSEVIQYAHSHGFFEIPRKIKSKAIAEKFQMTVSAFNEMLRRVERKLFNALFED